MESFARFVREIRARYAPERFVLFGSRARGNALVDSDFDLLIVSEVFRELSASDRVRGILARWPGEVGLDVICLTPGEYAGEAARGGSWLVREAVRGVDLSVVDEPSPPSEREMRDESRQWWTLGEADQAAGEQLAGSGLLHIAVFLAHQAAEKSLKALFMESEGLDPPKTHELESLARRLGAPDDVLRSARNLDPEFVVARYPSRALGNPIERYSADGAADRLSESRRVLAWVRTRLGGT